MNARWGADELFVAYHEIPVLTGVSVELDEGRVVAVVGGDGAGKTTLVRTLMGLVTPTSGELRRPAQEEIGYLPASSGVYPDLTVEENLRFAAGAYGLRRNDYRRARDELLERTGLDSARARLGGKLSGGMRQKLGLAMALVHSPRFLVLDEPSTGVDPVSRRELWRLVTEAALGSTAVLLTTTYLDEASRSDHVYVLDDGAVLLQGPPDEVIAATGGAFGEAVTRPEARHSWRRGAAWRLWTPEPVLPSGAQRVVPDLQDAVVVAALRKRDAEEVPA